MRIEELQIGDLLRVNRDGLCIKKWTVVEVRGIDADDNLIEKGLIGSTHCRPLDDNQFDGGIWCEYLDPIPLTPEILEKNGFIKDKENELSIYYHILIPTGYEKNSYTIQITFYKVPIAGVNLLFKCSGWLPPDNCGMNDIHMCNVEYVHQVQHALRLCGIEKEIQI